MDELRAEPPSPLEGEMREGQEGEGDGEETNDSEDVVAGGDESEEWSESEEGGDREAGAFGPRAAIRGLLASFSAEISRRVEPVVLPQPIDSIILHCCMCITAFLSLLPSYDCFWLVVLVPLCVR